ncbi:unnamed protein product [Blepharisma stoltei]|uniref:Photosystem I assembly protein Ycf4 n=1 Tax=Blepharisma stoltei TaxID=1481888 RepID=A0AAU9K2Q0_9CILI|nr:unnamed protein product [Blepharisma stoltei]
MWGPILLSIGFVLGYLTCAFDLDWVGENLSISLWDKWLFVLTITISIYILGLFLPLYRLVSRQVIESSIQKPISVRQELKRRGSWPMAYSRSIHTRYKEEIL